MASQSKKSEQIVAIIDNIRVKILEMLAENKDGDPWNEEKEGVAWIDNEVGFVIEFLRIVNPGEFYPKSLYDLCDTIAETQKEMEKMTDEDIRFIHFFILKLGGTDCEDSFDLREKSRDFILTWLREKGFRFKSEVLKELKELKESKDVKKKMEPGLHRPVCHLCKKEGKLKSCSGCMSVRYCSFECQKNDWKSHKKDCKDKKE